MTTTTKDLKSKLRLGPGTALWIWPEVSATTPEVSAITEPLWPDEDLSHTGVTAADAAVLVARDRAAVDEVLTRYRDRLATLRAVWIVYAKGNRTDINRDTLWVQLAEYGWRAVSQVSFDESHSALRVRPLKDGEQPRTA